MNKNRKKSLWGVSSLGAVAIAGTTLISCGEYSPSPDTQDKLKYLSGDGAHNKVLFDYYRDTSIQMFKDSSFKESEINQIWNSVFDWYVYSQQKNDQFYWNKKRTEWIQNEIITKAEADEHFSAISETEPFYFLNRTEPTATFFKDNQLSGLPTEIDKLMYSMAYLLLTNAQDVQSWLKGDTTAGDENKFKTDIKNEGEYFLIDYLRINKPMVMWKTVDKNRLAPKETLDGTIEAFNAIVAQGPDKWTNQELHRVGSLLLNGPGESKAKIGTGQPTTDALRDLQSYEGFTTTNNFKNKNNDMNPDDDYIKTTSKDTGNGGKQGWLNNNGILGDTGNAVRVSADESDYAYIQQILPKYNETDKQYELSDWMTNPTTPGSKVEQAKWLIAFQTSFNSSQILEDAKAFWVQNGYNLKIPVPVLDKNLDPEHLYK